MPEFVGGLFDELIVPNPTCPDENYADRYKENPAKKAALGEWLERLQQDSTSLFVATGTPQLTSAVDSAFGPGLGERVAKRLGEGAQRMRSSGGLGSTTAGTLVADRGRRHKDHTFYGAETE